MKGQIDKKRNVIIGGVKLRLKSKRISVNGYPNITNIGKVMFNKIWYTFNIETGEIISQGEMWTTVLNDTKKYIDLLNEQKKTA